MKPVPGARAWSSRFERRAPERGWENRGALRAAAHPHPHAAGRGDEPQEAGRWNGPAVVGCGKRAKSIWASHGDRWWEGLLSTDVAFGIRMTRRSCTSRFLTGEICA